VFTHLCHYRQRLLTGLAGAVNDFRVRGTRLASQVYIGKAKVTVVQRAYPFFRLVRAYPVLPYLFKDF
jgi:hypothetical protein